MRPLFILVILVFARQTQSTHQTKLVYPNLHSVNSDGFEKMIFDGAKTKHGDGVHRHSVHVTGANGNTFEMNYMGKYNERNGVHNMDEDSALKYHQCDEGTVVLHYASPREASRTLSKLTGTDELDHMLLTGSRLWSCPHSSPTKTNMLEGIRRVKSAQIDAAHPTIVVIETESGHLTDVFEDLELTGTATLLNINHNINVAKYNADIQEVIDAKSAFNEGTDDSQLTSRSGRDWVDAMQQSEEANFRSRMVEADKRKKKKQKNGFLKKAIRALVKAFDDFKPGNLMFWTKMMKKASRVFRKAFKKIDQFIPSWEKKGKHTIPSKYNYGFNSKNGKAKEIYIFTRKGGLETYEGTLKELRAEIKSGANPPKGTAIYCLQCFVGVHGSKIVYRIKLGGAKLGQVKLVFETTLSAVFEILTKTKLKKEFDIPIADVPVPVLSVPLGVMTLGFAIGGNVAVGLEFESTFAYYKYVHKTKFRAGAKFQLLPIPKFEKIREAKAVKRKSIGPVVYTYAKAEFYLRPTIQLVFTDVANVFVAPQPTLVFRIKKPKRGSCAIKLRIDFECPVFVGFELGLTIKGYDFPTKTKEWSLKLKYPKLKEACISKNAFIKNSKLFGAGAPPRVKSMVQRGGERRSGRPLEYVWESGREGGEETGTGAAAWMSPVVVVVGGLLIAMYLVVSKQLVGGKRKVGTLENGREMAEMEVENGYEAVM